MEAHNPLSALLENISINKNDNQFTLMVLVKFINRLNITGKPDIEVLEIHNRLSNINNR